MHGLAKVIQDTVNTVMEYRGGTGPSFSGAGCGVLVVAAAQLVCQPQGLWLGFTVEESKASTFITISCLVRILLRPVSHGDLQDFFSDYQRKGQKDLENHFAKERIEN